MATQNLTLQPGWNAVWIDPSPLYTTGTNAGQAMAVADVVPSTRVTAVARPLLAAGSAEFVSDSASVFNQDDWLVWYRDPQSMINTLTTISGNQAYYVRVEGGDSPLTVTLSGRVGFFRPTWVPGSYNFLGFNLSSSVSFGEFFGAAGKTGGNHPINSILRLDPVSGEWVGVQADDLMHPGEAYWILSARNSRFAGPVAIDFDGLESLPFGAAIGSISVGDPPVPMSARELTFSNTDDAAHALGISLVSPVPAEELRVHQIVPNSTNLNYSVGPAGQITSWDLGPLAARTTRTVTLGAQRDWTTGDRRRENLYRIDVGAQYFWLPVSAINEDVSTGDPGSPDASRAGLWVGEVRFDAVNRVSGEAALARTTSTAAMRVILHVDESGAPWLLGHVMLMMTRTADPSVPAEEVLVLNEARIPYFEGIETRGGKRVGKRIEAVAYDLPRQDDPATQAALLDEVVAANPSIGDAADVTAADIQAFLMAQTSRPPDLVESYHLKWPLEGGLGAGSVVRTSPDAPLTLDPFHRSNPFRHAYHPSHGAGYGITRSLVITFDADQQPGFLQGVYQESISGLNSHPIVARGRIVLARVSTATRTE
jgi:hypothetical protein